MHDRNPYRTPIDFHSLSKAYPKLESFLKKNTGSGAVSIDFKDAEAQRCLTEAFLWRDFQLRFSLPEGRLCPPVPNRLNYILWIQEVISESLKCLDKHEEIIGVDIGTGASAIYPLLGCKANPTWKFIGTELDPISYESAVQNVEQNDLHDRIKILKVDSSDGILVPLRNTPSRIFSFTMCNPPFYSNTEEIERSTDGKALEPNSVCTGAEVEMITPGGEVAFVRQMITESTVKGVRDRCLWFTSMLGKLSSLEKIVETMRTEKIDNYALTELVQGQTRRWVVAWSFSNTRLPDNVARGLPSIHQGLLPRRNSFRQSLTNSGLLDSPYIRDCLLGSLSPLVGITVLDLHPVDSSVEQNSVQDSVALRVSALHNSWSRAARRANKTGGANIDLDKPAAMVADIYADRGRIKGMECWVLQGTWRRGTDRQLFESFWSHLSTKVAANVEATMASAYGNGRKRMKR